MLRTEDENTTVSRLATIRLTPNVTNNAITGPDLRTDGPMMRRSTSQPSPNPRHISGASMMNGSMPNCAHATSAA